MWYRLEILVGAVYIQSTLLCLERCRQSRLSCDIIECTVRAPYKTLQDGVSRKKNRIRAYTFRVDPSAKFLSELGTIQFILFSSLCPTQIIIRPRCHHRMCMPVLYIIVAIRNVTHDTPCFKRCAIKNLIVCHTATLSGPPRTGTAQKHTVAYADFYLWTNLICIIVST